MATLSQDPTKQDEIGQDPAKEDRAKESSKKGRDHIQSKGLRSPRWAVTAMFILNGALYGSWAARIPSLKHSFDLSAGDLGLLLLLMSGGAIAAFPVSGGLTDRFGSAKVTLVCAVVCCVSIAMVGYSPVIAMLCVAVVLFGAGLGAMDVAMNAWAAEVERDYGRSIMSSFHAFFSVGAGIGAGLGAIAAWEGISYGHQFFILALILSPLIWFSALPNVFSPSKEQLIPQKDKPEPETTKPKGPRLIMPRGALLVVALVAFSCAVGEGAMADWSAVFLTSVIKVGEGQAAFGYTVFSITMVAMRFVGDRLIIRFGPVNILRFCGGAALIGSSITATASGLWMTYLGLALMGVGYSIVFPLVFSRAANSKQLSPGVAIASVATFSYGGLLLGPPLIGFIAEISSLRFAFGLFVLLALVVVIGSVAFRQNEVKD
ncbi:MFS transporter [uncultured Kiloniella sp.]|uniref:MFS transporter n=1 Tax=uncultured Kiloniella sp. TaxID=1133091 RepID=UPI00260DF89C|nr:MFS transporter [uncultured Kiloniella sp.]